MHQIKKIKIKIINIPNGTEILGYTVYLWFRSTGTHSKYILFHVVLKTKRNSAEWAQSAAATDIRGKREGKESRD